MLSFVLLLNPSDALSDTMAAVPKVILILGSGANVGHHVTKAFIAKGYKVALTSRSAKEEGNSSDIINIAADLSDPDSVAQVFSKVKSSFGIPSVVVYNGRSQTDLSRAFV